MALLVLMLALVTLDVLALRFGAESRDGFKVRRGGSTSATAGPGRLVAGWRR